MTCLCTEAGQGHKCWFGPWARASSSFSKGPLASGYRLPPPPPRLSEGVSWVRSQLLCSSHKCVLPLIVTSASLRPRCVQTELQKLQRVLSCAPYLYIANSLHGESLFKYISLLELYSSFIACFKTSWTLSFSTFGIYFGGSFINLVCVKLKYFTVNLYSFAHRPLLIFYVSSEMRNSFVIF